MFLNVNVLQESVFNKYPMEAICRSIQKNRDREIISQIHTMLLLNKPDSALHTDGTWCWLCACNPENPLPGAEMLEEVVSSMSMPNSTTAGQEETSSAKLEAEGKIPKERRV